MGLMVMQVGGEWYCTLTVAVVPRELRETQGDEAGYILRELHLTQDS